MTDSVWSELSKWLRLIMGACCDFMFLALWGFMALALHRFTKEIWQFEGWALYVKYAMEALIDVSTLIRLIRLRFSFSRSREANQWWK